MEDNKITFKCDDGTEESFYAVEQTKLSGVDYILVTDQPDSSKEANAFILKDVSAPEDAEAVYEFVEDNAELNALWDIFSELLGEDADLL